MCSRRFLRVECIEQHGADEIGRPYHGRRGHEEASADATDAEADQLRTHHEHPLVAEAVLLLVEHALHRDDVRRIRGLRADAAHDRDEHVLLDGEGPRVEGHAEHADSREERGAETAQGEGEELWDELGEGRVLVCGTVGGRVWKDMNRIDNAS